MADALDTIFGYIHGSMSNSTTISTQAMNQSTDQLEFIFASKTTDAITHGYIRLTSITGTTPTYRMSIQGVDASGNPDGTIKGGGSPVSKTFSPSSLGWSANSGHWLQFDNSYTPTRGEMLALVIDYSSGTIDASNLATLSNGFSISATSFTGLPYVISNDAGSRTRVSAVPIFGYRTASARYGNPMKTLGLIGSFNSGTSPSEYALKFTLPAGWGDTFTVRDIYGMLNIGATGNATFRLYDGGNAGDTTVLQNVSYDCDHARATGAEVIEQSFDEATLSTLTFGNTYRLAVAPDTVNMNFTVMDVEEAADWGAWQGGSNCLISSRAGGNWTDTATRRIVNYGFKLGDITEPAGGGGGFVWELATT